jgi:hypothetical protein
MAGPPDGEGFTIQAVDQMFLGDVGWDGTVSPTNDDWQTFALNIDGLHFTDASQAKYHCRLQSGGDAADEVLDGEGGVDNSFGRNVLPIIEAFASTPTASFNADIASGQGTQVLQLAKLGSQTSYSGLVAQWFGVRGVDAEGGAPGPTIAPTAAQWMDGSYVWHPWAEALVDPLETDPIEYQSTLRFPNSYVSGDTWVSGPRGAVDMTSILPAWGGLARAQFAVHMNVARITMQLDADHRGAAKGIISGVLPVATFVESIRNVATQISTSFCDATIDSILSEITSCSDIGADGTQDPTKLCDGISIGIGFTTKLASLGEPEAKFVPGDNCGMP